jgi:hypothetical protein
MRALTIRQSPLCHNVRMPYERPYTLRQIDQARGDRYAIGADLEFMPTRGELAQTALAIIFCSSW